MKLRKIARKVLPLPVVLYIKKQLEKFETKESRLKRMIADKDVHIRQIEWLVSEYKMIPPVPPKHLQVRVSGDYYWRFFLHGRNMLQDINKALEPQGLSMNSFDKILDFGCGCGRFLIPLSMMTDPEKLYGCDIDTEAIEWFASNYKNLGGLYANPHNPPTKYENNTFDFIYSVSIFTHLPEDMQFAWLKELRRITKKNGWLVITTHGIKFIDEIPVKYHAGFREKGFSYFDKADITDGLPKFYRGAFHLHHYIQSEWSKYFRVVSIIEQGMGAHQDLILLQKITD